MVERHRGRGPGRSAWRPESQPGEAYARIEGDRLPELLAARSIRVAGATADGSVIDVPFPPGDTVPASFRACMDAARPTGTGSGKPAVTPPRPRDPLPWLFKDDYPGWARRDQIGGDIRMRLTVAADGRVAGCTVIQSVGNRWMDAYSCGVLRRRGRFVPARDGEGWATLGRYDYAHTW